MFFIDPAILLNIPPLHQSFWINWDWLIGCWDSLTVSSPVSIQMQSFALRLDGNRA